VCDVCDVCVCVCVFVVCVLCVCVCVCVIVCAIDIILDVCETLDEKMVCMCV